eukprot:TRINITY_DN25672_c0_g1_i1.p1 TRINITY_DN25672_c0_g1~~TRINITY_DN25672_c0_g1_i1.p1  ORF type:complete len:935 (-),score=184.64 TRINITY_DN25672_c0_g1_i1:525-3281(-)
MAPKRGSKYFPDKGSEPVPHTASAAVPTTTGSNSVDAPQGGATKRRKFSIPDESGSTPSPVKSGGVSPAVSGSAKPQSGSVAAFFSRSFSRASQVVELDDNSTGSVSTSVPPSTSSAAVDGTNILEERASKPPPQTVAAAKPQRDTTTSNRIDLCDTGRHQDASSTKSTLSKVDQQVTPTSAGNSTEAREKPGPLPAAGRSKLMPASTSQPANDPQKLPVSSGKPGLPLDGVLMAFTGEMDAMTRVDAEDKAKSAGAKVMGSVSGTTRYLVVGSHLDDGRQVEETSKYKKYVELKKKVEDKGKGKHPDLLTEAEFLALLGLGSDGKPLSSSSQTQSVPPPKDMTRRDDVRTSAKELASWVDLHAPRSFNDLVGNPGVVKKISEWFRDWDSVVLKGNKKKVPFKPGGGIPDNVNARALLVSGPPGIGKTTTCRLIANQLGGYEVLEFNASDARGQKIIQEMANGIADNTTISFGANVQSKMPKLTKRACIIMDEVDGMGAGDRGGNAALIKMIKKTKNPIMCICNDEHSQKIRSLAGHCYHTKFTRPTKASVANRCAEIARHQGLNVEANALEELAESCGSDMRQVLNQLQMLAKSPRWIDSGVKYTDMKQRLHEFSKDQQGMMSPFDACKKLLNSSEGKRLSFRDRLDLFFVDHSLVGLLTQENYLKSVERASDASVMQRCAFSADLFTVGDIMNARISSSQDWSVLPYLGICGAVYPAHVTNGMIAFPSFPQFLGKYSTQSKTRRLCTELASFVRLGGTVRKRGLVTSGYTDLLYRRAVDPLLNSNSASEAVEASVAVLDAYGFQRDHLTEHLTELRQHLCGDDMFKQVDPRVKASVTREMNSGSHAPRVVIPAGKRRKVDVPEDMDEEEMDREPVAAEEADAQDDKSDDDGGGALVKVKKKGNAKGKAKGKAKAGR